jgi:hypothetical protein
VNLNLPARKSASEIFSDDAVKPATSTTAPPPMNTPLGLMSSTRPFESNCPRMLDDSDPVTRLSTDDAALF